MYPVSFAVSLKSSVTLLESYLIRQSVHFLPLVLSVELYLPEYSEQELQNMVIKLVCEKYKLDEETAKEIARVVWHEIKTKDIRDASW
jgi:predicted nucleic acid-binding protein